MILLGSTHFSSISWAPRTEIVEGPGVAGPVRSGADHLGWAPGGSAKVPSSNQRRDPSFGIAGPAFDRYAALGELRGPRFGKKAVFQDLFLLRDQVETVVCARIGQRHAIRVGPSASRNFTRKAHAGIKSR